MTKAVAKQGTRVSQVARIGGVRLVEGSGKCRFRDPDDLPEQAEVQVAHEGHITGPPDEEGRFFVHATAEVRVVDPQQKEPALLVTVVFELAYRLPQGFAAETEELDAFAGVNGVFNAWPYLREFVQNMTTRMNVPPVVLPLFRNPTVQKGVRAGEPDKKALGNGKHNTKRLKE
jgi:hypothetical protein